MSTDTVWLISALHSFMNTLPIMNSRDPIYWKILSETGMNILLVYTIILHLQIIILHMYPVNTTR